MSPNGLNLLIQREGKRNKAYKDTKGIWTIGVGHTGPDVLPNSVWSDAQVSDALQKDLIWAEHAVNSVTIPLTQNQFDALVSFTFNVGIYAFNTSTLKRLLNLGKYEEIPAQLDRWHIPPEITPRRDSEKAQFLMKDV